MSQMSHVSVHEAYQMIIQKAHCYIVKLLKISSEVGNRASECVYHLGKEVTILYTCPRDFSQNNKAFCTFFVSQCHRL